MRGQKIGSMYNVIKTLIEAANRSTVGQPIRPAKKFWVVTLQTPLKFWGQNLIGDQFLGWSEAVKVCPQAILGPRATPPVSPLAPGPKIAWGHTFPAFDRPHNWSPNRYWPKNFSGVWSVTTQKISAGLAFYLSVAETTEVKNGLECNKFSPESPQGYSLRSLKHIVKNCMIFLKHLECLSGISTGDCSNFWLF